MSKGRYRFFPEIVLGLRSKGADDSIVSYKKRRSSGSDQAYWISVNIKALRADGFSRIRRIDGNHRLEAAKRLFEDERHHPTIKSHSIAPFCFVVLDSDRPEDDELAEAMLFNLINSKAKAISSEHSLNVLMRDEGTASDRFIEDPQVYLTRWIKDKIKDWPNGFFDALGENPLTRLHSTAGVLLRPNGISNATANEMEVDAGKIFSPIFTLAVQMREHHEKFVHSYAFLPVAAEVYARHSTVDPAKGANTEEERIRRSARWLRDFARWFERIGGSDFPLPADPSILWTVFKRDFDKRAGQVFIAMSFRESRALEGVYSAIKEAIDAFNLTHPNALLRPERIDKQHGESFEIPSAVFREIDESRIVIADLTDERQNVYCEIGYAKAKGIPFFLTFQKKNAVGDKKSTAVNKVHLDLVPYRYIEYESTHELRDKLKKELDAWHDKA